MIRVSQWAEVRHMHLAEGIAKKEIARRLGLDIKTVRRALAAEQAPLTRASPPRPFMLDPWREQVERWLKPAVEGKRTCAITITESGAGSDAAGPGAATDFLAFLVAKLVEIAYPRQRGAKIASLIGRHPAAAFQQVAAELGQRITIRRSESHACNHNSLLVRPISHRIFRPQTPSPFAWQTRRR